MAKIPLDPSLLEGLAGKTAIVTGGANGIGAETVRLLHSYGANVVVADLPKAQLLGEALVSALSSHAIFEPTDITNWSSVSKLFAFTKQKFGSIEIVIANAGIMETKPFFDFDLDDDGNLKEPLEAYTVIDVNLKGTMNTLRLAMYHMRSNTPCFGDGSKGTVVLVSSTSGYFGGTAVVSYVSSKHGVMGLLRSSQRAATENSIRVNAVAPFVTPTFITSSYLSNWRKAGLLENDKSDVAFAIAQTAMDETFRGRCCLIVGKTLKETEGPREMLTGEWFGDDTMEQMTKGGKLFDELGGYPLPQPRT